ncbi:hypothetical protein RND81_12G213600 [Saponaria officinalis]|uniref:ARM repeat superfamily protein n=1 Tax=Saponaria officinalis TaxID=3572 RepID=A0AAW1HDQ2_SAPOF
MEEFSASQIAQIVHASSDFALYPGTHNEGSVKEFLDRFPLPVIMNLLQTKADVPDLENALVACLERIFKTKYGSSLIPHYMPFLQAGLQADSEAVKCLACKTVSCLFENLSYESGLPAQLVIENDIYPLLLHCLVSSDEQVATAATDAIKNFASTSEGIATIFPTERKDSTDLGHLASKCSSLGRIRILSLIVKLFSISHAVASVIHSSNLLGIFEIEVSKTNDILATLSVLELLYELNEIEHAAEFLPMTSLLQLLTSIISNSVHSILRSRAMVISGRMLSKENTIMFVEETNVLSIVSAIKIRLESSESIDGNECESALEAIGQIGSSARGAELLLLRSPEVVKLVTSSAFDGQRRGKQLAALHSLGNIAGVNRSGTNILLGRAAEESFQQLFYDIASTTSKLTPSGLLLSVLKQDSETRAAGYRLISGLVARAWSLSEVCSRQDIINIVTDAYIEDTKIGMESRHDCCLAIHNALISSNLKGDSILAGISVKLQEAIKRGPYLTQKQAEARPTVLSEQRF